MMGHKIWFNGEIWMYIPKLLRGFMSLSTIFKPYEDNQRVNMQDSVQAVLLRF